MINITSEKLSGNRSESQIIIETLLKTIEELLAVGFVAGSLVGFAVMPTHDVHL